MVNQDNSENKKGSSCFKYIAANVVFILLLLMVTEGFLHETVLRQFILLFVTLLVALLPLIGMFLFDLPDIVSVVSVPATVFLCVVMFYLRSRVILFYIQNLDSLNVEDGKKIIDELSTSRIILIAGITDTKKLLEVLESSKATETPKLVELSTLVVSADIVQPTGPFTSTNISELYSFLRNGVKNTIYTTPIGFTSLDEAKKKRKSY